MLHRLRECSRQVEAEVVSNSSNKIHQTLEALDPCICQKLSCLILPWASIFFSNLEYQTLLNSYRIVSCQHWILSLQLELAAVLWWSPQTWVWCLRSSRSSPSSYSKRMLSECCFLGQPFLLRWAWRAQNTLTNLAYPVQCLCLLTYFTRIPDMQ